MIQGLLNWVVSVAAKPYRNILASRLRTAGNLSSPLATKSLADCFYIIQYTGVQYEDLLIESADVTKALARSSNVIRVERLVIFIVGQFHPDLNYLFLFYFNYFLQRPKNQESF